MTSRQGVAAFGGSFFAALRKPFSEGSHSQARERQQGPQIYADHPLPSSGSVSSVSSVFKTISAAPRFGAGWNRSCSSHRPA